MISYQKANKNDKRFIINGNNILNIVYICFVINYKQLKT